MYKVYSKFQKDSRPFPCWCLRGIFSSFEEAMNYCEERRKQEPLVTFYAYSA